MSTDAERRDQLDRAEILRRTLAKKDQQARRRSGMVEPPGKRHRHDERSAHFRLRSARKS